MNFCCVFPGLKNIDLIKHVGLTPYYLAKHHNYNSTIVCYNNDNYENLKKLNKLNLKKINKKYKKDILNYFLILKYIITNAKNIDVLNCYHLTIHTIISFLIYKLINKKGVAYFTFDMSYNSTLMFTNNKNIMYSMKRKIFIFILKHYIDFATIETKKARNNLCKYDKIFEDKLIYVPCFIDLDSKIDKKKKNQIISVGRIGSKYKSSDIILESFKKVHDKLENCDWVLKMVGPVSESFNEYIKNFFDENPHLKEFISFTGNIENKNELYEIYSESKIFILPSKTESFGIVFPEALYYGNYLIITGVGIGDYLIDISNYGQLVEIDNIEDISNKLADAIENYEMYEKTNDINFKKLIHDEFSHEKYIPQINHKINEIINNKS